MDSTGSSTLVNVCQPPDPQAVQVAVRLATAEFIAAMENAERQSAGWTQVDRARPLVGESLRRLLDRLQATGCRGEANRLPSSELWNRAGEWLKRGRLQRWARDKPHGYAGDFRLFAMIADQSRCDDPLGRIFDEYFQEQAAPRAVRQRVTRIAHVAVQQRRAAGALPFHWASVGGGPSLDVRQALLELPPESRAAIQVTLVDLDPAALEYAQRQLAPLLGPGQIRCRRENLFRLARRRQAAGLEDVDLLCCPGLFDYLATDDAVRLLVAFHASLAPRGRLLVFNFRPENPSRAYMEWIGNWYLRYRTSEELLDLARRACIPESSARVERDSLGVIAALDVTLAQ